jgi:hypothetical protein
MFRTLSWKIDRPVSRAARSGLGEKDAFEGLSAPTGAVGCGLAGRFCTNAKNPLLIRPVLLTSSGANGAKKMPDASLCVGRGFVGS